MKGIIQLAPVDPYFLEDGLYVIYSGSLEQIEGIVEDEEVGCVHLRGFDPEDWVDNSELRQLVVLTGEEALPLFQPDYPTALDHLNQEVDYEVVPVFIETGVARNTARVTPLKEITYTEEDVRCLIQQYGWWLQNGGFKQESFEDWFAKNKKI